jgi:hypothetical protein
MASSWVGCSPKTRWKLSPHIKLVFLVLSGTRLSLSLETFLEASLFITQQISVSSYKAKGTSSNRTTSPSLPITE